MHFGYPLQATSNVLAGKWKVLIVWQLGFGSKRFAEIRKLLPGVSEKVLTSQLPRVDYKLSPAGNELIRVMQAMCDWGSKHLGIAPILPPPPSNQYAKLQ